jgi:hypothetical protein
MLARSSLVLAVLLPVAACGGSTSEAPVAAESVAKSPKDVAVAFFEAAKAGDQDGAAGWMTETAREAMKDESGSFAMQGEQLGSYEIGEVSVDGTEAKVPVSAVVEGEQQEMTMLMRQDPEGWRIHGFSLAFPGGEMSVDLEHMDEMLQGMAEGVAENMGGALQEAFGGGSEQEIVLARERFESIAPLTVEAHEAAWRIDVSAAERPALAVLEEIVDDTGVVLQPGACAQALARPITLELAGVSRIEALERACAEAGVHAVYSGADGLGGAMMRAMAGGLAAMAGEEVPEEEAPAGPAIAFEPGPRAWPATFAGPFLVSVDDVVENVPNATGSITVGVRALGLHPACLALLADLMELVHFDRVTDAQDRSLNADEGVSYLGSPTITAGFLSSSTTIDLRNLLRDVTEIASVSGGLSYSIPTAVRAARCEADGGPVTVEGFEIAPEDWGAYTTLAVGVPEDNEGDLVVRLSPLDAEGAPMGMLSSDSMSWGDSVHASVQTPEPPAALDVKVCTVAALEHAFELTGVPLRHHAEMPEKLLELAFEGDAPVTVEFLRISKADADFPEIELRIRNVSNKNADHVSVDLRYLDASKAELGTFQPTLTGSFGSDGFKPFAAGAEEVQETTAFFMPEGTVSVDVSVSGVEFSDATTWSRDE